MPRAGGIELQPDEVVIARVVKARGIRGEVACEIATDFPERFESLERAMVVTPGGERIVLSVEEYWFHQDRVILKFEGYDDRNAVEPLVGARIVISPEDGIELEKGEYYEYDLIGAETVTVEGVSLGRVTELMRTGGTDLLVVKDEEQRERLIPFADDICIEIDLAAKRITVNPPQGLLDL
jgi:16S rRNA processing protein RimM